MPMVVDYEEIKTSFPSVFDYVSSNGCIVTVMRGGKAVVKISPVNVFRSTEPLEELSGEINCDLFVDESADWENA